MLKNRKNNDVIGLIIILSLFCILFLILILYLCNESKNISSRNNLLVFKNNSYNLINEENNIELIDNTYRYCEEKNIINYDKNTEPEQEEIKIKGYVTENLNIRKETNTNCEILDVLPIFTIIEFSYLKDNNEWVKIYYNDNTAYLYKKYVEEGLPYEIKNVTNDKRKSYMDWKTITSKSSYQWKLQNDYAYTTSNGLRAVNGRYCIALGSYYTHNIGQYIDVVLENGIIIPCILGDAKKDIHTNNNNSIGLDGGAVEFIVNTDSLTQLVRKTGDISYIKNEWKSNVTEIRIYHKNLFM